MFYTVGAELALYTVGVELPIYIVGGELELYTVKAVVGAFSRKLLAPQEQQSQLPDSDFLLEMAEKRHPGI